VQPCASSQAHVEARHAMGHDAGVARTFSAVAGFTSLPHGEDVPVAQPWQHRMSTTEELKKFDKVTSRQESAADFANDKSVGLESQHSTEPKWRTFVRPGGAIDEVSDVNSSNVQPSLCKKIAAASAASKPEVVAESLLLKYSGPIAPLVDAGVESSSLKHSVMGNVLWPHFDSSSQAEMEGDAHGLAVETLLGRLPQPEAAAPATFAGDTEFVPGLAKIQKQRAELGHRMARLKQLDALRDQCMSLSNGEASETVIALEDEILALCKGIAST